jgi:hypothetical protein
MAEKNSLWKNIRKKAEQNRRTGATPKKPTTEMLRQEKKIKAKKYQDGGPVKTDRYGNPIDAKVEINPNYINSEYDPRTNTIYLGQDYNDLDDYWKSKILAHENYHAFQFNDGYSTELPYDVPYKKPAMPTTDDEFYGYHNRKINESFRGIDKFKKDSEFQFVPDEVVFDKAVNENLYNDPTTLEGEARNYERSGEFTSEENFLKTLEQQKAKGGYMYANGGGTKDKIVKIMQPESKKLSERSWYNSATGEIKTALVSPDNKTWQEVEFDINGKPTTKGMIKHQLPEVEISTDSPDYDSEGFRKLLGEKPLEYVPVESALLPASLPFKATTALGKVGKLAAEVVNPIGGFKATPKKLSSSSNVAPQQMGFFNTKGALQKYPKGKLTQEEIKAFKNSDYYKQSVQEHLEVKNKYGDSWTLPNYAEEALEEAIATGNRNRINPILYGGRNWGAADYTIAGLAGTAYPGYAGIMGLAFSPPAVKNKVLNSAGITSTPGSLSSRDTTIDLTNRNMDFAKVNQTADGQMILGGEFIENTNNTVRKAKDWLSATDTYSDKEYPSKTIQSFYGIEDGKFKVGKASDFNSNTEIVPRRFGATNINKAVLNEGAMRLLDNQGNPIYQNTPNTGKFILYSPSTKKSEFNYISSGKKGVDKVNRFLKQNKDAQYIHLDNGRYEFYGINSDGLTNQDYRDYYQQDLEREGNPGYNMILKAEGGYFPTQGPGNGLFKGYAKGGYMYADGGAIIDPRGQWAHPGKRTIVPSPTGQITMQGVPYPVYGEDETGYGQIMYPNNEYQFPGQMIHETPMKMQGGGTFPKVYNYGERTLPFGFRRGFIDIPGMGYDDFKTNPSLNYIKNNWDKLTPAERQMFISGSKKDVGAHIENAINTFAPLVLTAGTAYLSKKGYDWLRDPKNKPVINRFKREIHPSRLIKNVGDLFNKESEFTFAKGGSVNNSEDDVFKSSSNIGKEFSKPVADFYTTWMNSDETIRRFDELFPALPSVIDKIKYDPDDLPQILSERNIYNIEHKIPGFEKSIANTKVLYNPDPVINQELINKYIANLNPKYKEEVLKSMKKNPQGFTDPEGNIIVLNPDVNATDKYDPLSIVTHEGGHTYEIETKDGKKPLAKIMMAKFPTPEDNSVINELEREELYPFLMQLRFDQKFKPGEIITPERLQEIKKSGYNNHLFRYYNNEVLSKILNTLASNKQQSPYEQYAAKGGYLYQDGGDINPGKQKAVVSTTSVNTKLLPQEVIEDFNRYVSRIPLPPTKIIDKRVYNPVTKTKIKPTRDLLSGEYDTSVINNLVKYSKEYDVDPYLALAVGLQETQLGKTDSNIGHVMDLLNEDSNAERNLVSTLKDKMDYAKKLGYKDTKHLIQAYNGLGTITPETEKKYHGFKMKSIYGVPIPKEGINMSKTPLYGEKIQNIADSVLKQNPNIVNIVNTVKAQGGPINPYMYYAGGPYNSSGYDSSGYNPITKTYETSKMPSVSEGQFFPSKQTTSNKSTSMDPMTIMALAQTADQINKATNNVMKKQASKFLDLDEEEQKIAFSADETVGNIPIVGTALSNVGNMWNAVTGKTKTRLKDLENKRIGEGQSEEYMNRYTNNFITPTSPNLNFAATGGDINNLVTLQNPYSMKNRYKDYKQGGSFNQFGINKIPDSAGYHHENAYGGVPIGQNAMAEGGEFVIDGNYVVSDEVDGMNTQTDELGNTMAEKLEKRLNKYTLSGLSNNSFVKKQLRRPNDSYSAETIEQLKQNSIMETEVARAKAQAEEQQNQMMVNGALQIAAAGGKLNNDLERILSNDIQNYVEADNYYAYGGRIVKDLNMPNSYAKGGSIHIKKSKRGTFTAAAKKRGMSVQEFARQVLANKGNYSAAMVKKANFARNAAGWKHAEGGPTDPPDQWSLPIASRSNINQGSRNIITAGAGNNLPFTEQGTRIINEYDNGLKRDTTYSYMTPTENFFYNTGQNQPDGKPVMNYQGSNPNPNINDYLPKIKGLSRYAAGGPMVSNVQQPFEVAAQNRGGMLMDYANGGYVYQPMVQPMLAEGGNMYQGGGPVTDSMYPIMYNIGQQMATDYENSSPLYDDMSEMTTQYAIDNRPPLIDRIEPKSFKLPNNNTKPKLTIKEEPIYPTPLYEPFPGRSMNPNPYATIENPVEGDILEGTYGQNLPYKRSKPPKSPSPDEPWYEEPWYSKAARYGQGLPDLAASIYALTNLAKRKLPYRKLGAQTVNYEPERIIDREESRRRFDTFADRIKNSGNRMFGNLLREGFLQSNKDLAGRIEESIMREKNTNAQLAQQTGMAQFGANRETDALNEQNYQNAMTYVFKGAQGATDKLASAATEERQRYLQEWIARNRMNTRSYKTSIGGKDVYVSPDGKMYDEQGNPLSA